MKTIFIPDYRNGNSYQTNLANSISKHGAHIYFDNKVLWAIIQHWKPDVLHIHWPYPFMISNNGFITTVRSTGFICEMMLLKMLGIKIIWTVHNIIGHEEKSKHLQLFFNRILAKLSNRLIVHCPSAREEVKKLYGKDLPITIAYHGNYIGHYKNAITHSDARNMLKLNTDDIIFLHFGYIRSYKGVLELIDAFKKVNNQKIKILIVGKPRDDKIAIDILNKSKDDERIKNILRFIPDDDIQIYMNAADVIILPYKNILTSGATILAMSFGKPVVAPVAGCIKDILNERGAFLYPTNTNSNLFEAIKNASNTDISVLRDMGKHNFKLIEQFRWDDIGKRIYDIYQECVTK